MDRNQIEFNRNLMLTAKRIWERVRGRLPQEGFFFSRPLLILQSDDWGRVGLRDRDGFEELRAAGIHLGERPYDLYTLETAEDVHALASLLRRHCDSRGRPPVVGMNFLTANLNFSQAISSDASTLNFVPLAQGLPDGWFRPGLLEAYREGIGTDVLYPALHGISHFSLTAVQRCARDSGERGVLLRTFWKAKTPYIHWRMPWIGYEYWDPQATTENRFLGAQAQSESIGRAVGLFAQMFQTMPHSACAPGYRANSDTHHVWSQYGIRCAQNGPASGIPPHFDRHGLLQLYRNVEFEPATSEGLSAEGCLQQAEMCFAAGIPAIVSMHSINLHSTVRDFRARTLPMLDEFLSALEARHDDLLYVHDGDLSRLVETGVLESAGRLVKVDVVKRRFWKTPAIGEITDRWGIRSRWF